VPILYHARWSFLGQNRSLIDTGRLMARWAEAAAELLAPELAWETRVQEHADFELIERWETSHVVYLLAGTMGKGESRLVAGGRRTHVGGSSRIVVRTASPTRFLEVDSHCDVTHWDVRAAGVERAAVDAMRARLEQELGVTATLGGERGESYDRGPRRVALTHDEADARMWAGDLDDVGLPSGVSRRDEGWEVLVQASEIRELGGLDEARVTLGEVLAEAGEESWAEVAEALLAQLPSAAR